MERFTTMRKYFDICRQEENLRKSDGLGQAIADNIGAELSIPIKLVGCQPMI